MGDFLVKYQRRLMIFVSIVMLLGWIVALPSRPTAAQIAPRPTTTPTAVVAKAKYTNALVQGDQQEMMRLVVTLANPWGFEQRTMARRAVESRRNQVRQAQSDFVARNGTRLQRVNGRTTVMPTLFVEATRAQIPLLAQDASVAWIEQDIVVKPLMDVSAELIGSREVNQSGFDGTGTSVAVFDTGTSNNHPFLTGQVVGEACFSTTVSGTGFSYATVCPNGTNFQEGTGSAAPYGTWDHGNHVSGTIAGKVMTTSSRNVRGVAPGAKIIGVQVFSRNVATGDSGSFTSDQIRAFDWLYQNINTSSWGTLAAINMSLGSSIEYDQFCDTDAMKLYIDQFRLDGVATVIASGNDGFVSGVGSPACISSAITVGATTNGVSGASTTDKVATFSNSPSPQGNLPNARGDRLLDLFAPGTDIYSAGNSTGVFETMSGTSMATPHVAGAFAVMRQMRPQATVSQILQILTRTGKPISDSTGLVVRRIDLKAAAASLASVTPTAVPTRTPIPNPTTLPGNITGWGDATDSQITPPTSGAHYRLVEGGIYFTAALKSDGTVVTWGDNTYGVLNVPAGLSNVVDIDAGFNHVLALKRDGTIVAWGRDDDGESTIPMYASNNIIKVAAGRYHSLAVRSDGSVVGWGYNASEEATAPPTLDRVVDVAAGDQFSMALRSDGTVYVWGDDTYNVVSDMPLELMTGSPGVVQISAGRRHAVALKRDGTVVAWGDNARNQTAVPAGLKDVTAISTQYDHTLALRRNGTVVAWGLNGDGQSTIPSTLGPVQQLSAGGYHSMVVLGPPAAFAKSAPANNATGRPIKLTLSWVASKGATTYEYCLAMSASQCTKWTSVGNKLNVTVNNLQRNKTYFWQVRAKNSVGTTVATGGVWKFTTVR
jgi:subtilisin family serine protease